MMNGLSITDQVATVLRELADFGGLKAGQILVIGTSTSEVVGQRIGTAGAEAIAAQIYKGIAQVQHEIGFYAAYQCCEHLNRALVVERALLDRYAEDPVAAVPHPKAGGAMAAYAYRQMREACLIETVKAHAGIDIGDTLIGMHLRRVAVPFRPSLRKIGEAHVNMAYTRPKYIGGPRAIYTIDEQLGERSGTCT